MNIGVFGHSIANWGNKEPWSYITKLQDHFNANIVNSGCAMCSEERILFQLKKIKKLDLAIIFHCDPMNFFIPSWDRDLSTSGREVDLSNKFNLIINSNLDKLTKHQHLLDFLEKEAIKRNQPYDEQHTIRLLSEENAPVIKVLSNIADHKKIQITPDMLVGDVQQTLTELLKTYIDDDIFYKELIDALILNKKYLYHPDLQQNRYYGALIQVDQYTKSKQIPTIHCLGRDFWYPTWFSFTYGIIDKELQKFHGGKYPENSSSSPEGNAVMFEKLLDLISAARSKEVIH